MAIKTEVVEYMDYKGALRACARGAGKNDIQMMRSDLYAWCCKQYKSCARMMFNDYWNWLIKEEYIILQEGE